MKVVSAQRMCHGTQFAHAHVVALLCTLYRPIRDRRPYGKLFELLNDVRLHSSVSERSMHAEARGAKRNGGAERDFPDNLMSDRTII